MITSNNIVQISFYLGTLLVFAKFLGLYIAKVATGDAFSVDKFCFAENTIYRICKVRNDEEMDWKTYAFSILIFNIISILLLYTLTRIQHLLPFNPQHSVLTSPSLAFNIAVSFATNTNWQPYSDENTLSYLVKMLGLTVQNFASAATGMAVLFALIRGIARKETKTIGNFWVDLVRVTLYIFLPLSIILSLALVSQGVVQNIKPHQETKLLQVITHVKETTKAGGNKSEVTIKTVENEIKTQKIPMGPAASEIAIKQLGTNGGGFFQTNSAHPLENPTPLSNFLEMFAILLIPMSLCFTFGYMVKDKKQGIAVFLIMICLFIPLLFLTISSEQNGNTIINSAITGKSTHKAIGNMEGKETRIGVLNSAIWAASTTASSSGSTNSSLSSFTPLGQFVTLSFMQLGGMVFGGVGLGLCAMIIFIILTVFVSGLMVGRTPEYLGKKIETFEMKMASLAVITPHFLMLVFTAIALYTKLGVSSVLNPGAHEFTEILYTFVSTSSNNGSSFAGLDTNTTFYNLLCGIAMLFGRFWVIIPVLAIAGSLAGKKHVPESVGTMPTHTPLFIILTIVIVIIIGALAFFPSLALGPVAEHLMMIGH